MLRECFSANQLSVDCWNDLLNEKILIHFVLKCWLHEKNSYICRLER